MSACARYRQPTVLTPIGNDPPCSAATPRRLANVHDNLPTSTTAIVVHPDLYPIVDSGVQDDVYITESNRTLLTGRDGVHPTADASTPTAANAVAPCPRDRQPRPDQLRIYRPPRIAAPRRVADLHDNLPTSQTTTIPPPIPSNRSPPDTHKGKATI